MNNLPAHKGDAVRQVIEATGATLVFLPPYSPDFNPCLDSSCGVDPVPLTVHGYGGSGQFMMKPFVFDRREITQRRVAA